MRGTMQLRPRKDPTKVALDKSGFKHLEPHIRHEMLSYVVCDSTMRQRHPLNDNIMVNSGTRPVPPAICRVCKLFRTEALSLWLKNVFEIILPLGEDIRGELQTDYLERVFLLEEFVEGAVGWLNWIPPKWHADVRRLTVSITGQPGIWDSPSTLSRRINAIRRLAKCLEIRGYMSNPAKWQEQLHISTLFHEQDRDSGDCEVVLFKPVARYLLMAGIKCEGCIWTCTKCRQRVTSLDGAQVLRDGVRAPI